MPTMNLPADSVLPDLRESNHLLGDRAALDAEWEEHGYWFFRDVLSLEAIEEFRRPVREELVGIGVVDAEGGDVVWNGAALDRFPAANMAGYDPFPALVRSRRWMDFLARPKIEGFFERALGALPGWVAVAELRITPPGEDTSDGLFTWPHQDGFYNEGYRCLTAWMPLWPVSKMAGGLALAEGMHRTGYFHNATEPPRFPIPEGLVPQQAWRTADYRPGDVVLFDRYLPHSGQRNRSSRDFRVSFDVRCVLPGDPVPLLGHIDTVAEGSVVLRLADGSVRPLHLDVESYVRGVRPGSALRLPLAEVAEQYPPGQEVLVTLDGDRILLLREPKY